MEVISAFLADIGEEGLECRFPVNQTPREMHQAMERTIKGFRLGQPGEIPESTAPSIAEAIRLRNAKRAVAGSGIVPALAIEDYSKWYFQFAVDGRIQSIIRVWNTDEERNEYFQSWVLNI